MRLYGSSVHYRSPTIGHRRLGKSSLSTVETNFTIVRLRRRHGHPPKSRSGLLARRLPLTVCPFLIPMLLSPEFSPH